MQTFERLGGNFNSTERLQKYIRKTEPYKYQWKDDQDRTLEVRDSKSLGGEIKAISRGLMASETLKSLKKAQRREIKNVHLRPPLMKMPKNNEPDIVFSERDSRGIRQTYDNTLVIMLRVEKFNIHWVLIDNRNLADIIYLPMF